ncbi:hypothetical protein [Longimicrobium sp.]|jgi:hypothetical protein|uniref:hypothetical protein n=1 Tax=Longimicrobium sp. TaxID=2029185 RepID=UPI002EDAE36E
MSVRFRVEYTFVIAERGLFVLAGEIVEGSVRPGMVLQVPLNDMVTITAPVHGVEAVDASGQRSRTGLTLKCEDDIDLSLWRGLNLDGHVFTVDEPESEPQEPPSKPWWKLW